MEVVVFGISLGHLTVLLLAALFVLGPERLPGAVQWLADAVRRVRDLASAAQRRLETELEPEFRELRKPLPDLRPLDPATTLRRFLDEVPPSSPPALVAASSPPAIDPDAT
ncbi:Sec-independent protein translocase TatB [Amycolatopsis sp. NBC_00438]|uniref:Sec-independent protein translocase TatB n=1 Tax=Amycolatopsis sp. NBC_00438 TaxID=2903558 RepID=UPI002E1EF1F5